MDGKFYIINRTRKTNVAWTGKTWPKVTFYDGFADPGDTLELVEVVTEELRYHGYFPYLRQTVYSYGIERLSADGNSYVTSKQRAADWLSEQKCPTGIIIPKPRCRRCLCSYDVIGDAQSIRDTGLCVKCRTKENGKDVVIPRPVKA